MSSQELADLDSALESVSSAVVALNNFKAGVQRNVTSLLFATGFIHPQMQRRSIVIDGLDGYPQHQVLSDSSMVTVNFSSNPFADSGLEDAAARLRNRGCAVEFQDTSVHEPDHQVVSSSIQIKIPLRVLFCKGALSPDPTDGDEQKPVGTWPGQPVSAANPSTSQVESAAAGTRGAATAAVESPADAARAAGVGC